MTDDNVESLELDARPLQSCTGQGHSDPVEREVLRYSPASRREIRRLVKNSARLADLLTVFPGILFVLAARQRPASARLRALALIENGAQLKAVAKALDIPVWMKRLPPEAFAGLPPALPQSEAFGRRIVARLPRRAEESAFWLRSVLFAEKSCHEDFALWLARQNIFEDEGEPEKLIGVLAAYAWYSSAPSTAAHKLIVVPWRPEIAFDTALCAAKSWFNRVRLVLQLPAGVLADPWLKPGEALGYSFEPLLDQGDILAEAQAMHNCADQYAERLIRDKCRLFSVKRDGQRAATLEIGPHQRETGVLAIAQLKSRHNMSASTEVWQAAYAWLAGQTGIKKAVLPGSGDRAFDQAAWTALLAPYRNAKNGAPWFDDHASHAMFAAFDMDFCDMARRGGVSSWLFT